MPEAVRGMRVVVHDPRVEQAPGPDPGDGATPRWWPAPDGTTRLRATTVGTIALCYRSIGSTLHLSTQPLDLALIHPKAPLDEATLTRLANLDFPEDASSCYAGVRRVAPGCEVTLHDGGEPAPPRRWWEPAAEPAPGTAPSLWEALVQGCADTMAPGARGAVLLSGGIDSSAIAAATAEAARRNGQPAPLLLSIRYPGLSCDEGPYQAEVARHLGLEWETVDATASSVWPLDPAEPPPDATPPLDVQEGVMRALYRAARRHGCRVVLSGIGGDHLFDGRGLEGDLIQRGEFRAVAKWLASAASARAQAAWRAWWGRGLRPLLRPRPDPDTRGELDRAGSHARLALRMALANPTNGWLFETGDRSARAEGVELRHPYFSSRVLAAVGATPSSAHAADGRFKGGLRRAVAGRLPPAVVNRIPKASLIPFWELLARRSGSGELSGCRTARDFLTRWFRLAILHHRPWYQALSAHTME